VPIVRPTRPRPADITRYLPRAVAARLSCLLLCLALLSGCATRPVVRDDVATIERGERIARHAIGEVGRRYRYGGETSAGFDCSGLTSYVYGLEGIDIPRTAAAQFAEGPRVARDALRAGDLVFFRFSGRKVDHVGVYIGDGEFIHAPGTGSTVRRVQLDAKWFARRYAGAARWWRDGIAP
jgi:cell wall-associated NlpC family hydrolase